jgi:hypothetical protein
MLIFTKYTENITLNYLSDKVKICVSTINLLPVVHGKSSEYQKSDNGDTQEYRIKNIVFGFGADKI